LQFSKPSLFHKLAFFFFTINLPSIHAGFLPGTGIVMENCILAIFQTEFVSQTRNLFFTINLPSIHAGFF